jgi:hypothetical protein
MLIRHMTPEDFAICARTTNPQGWMHAWLRQFRDDMDSARECCRAELPLGDTVFYLYRANDDLANAIGWASRGEG